MNTLTDLKEKIKVNSIRKSNPYSIGLDVPGHTNIIEIHGMEKEDLNTLASYLVECIREMPITKKVSLNKKYRTRDGWEVKLFHIFNKGELVNAYVVRGAVFREGFWTCEDWDMCGRYYADGQDGEHVLDLVELK